MTTGGRLAAAGGIVLVGLALWLLARDGDVAAEPPASTVADAGDTSAGAAPDLPDAASKEPGEVAVLEPSPAGADEPRVATPDGPSPTVLTGRVTRAADGRPVTGVGIDARLSAGPGLPAAVTATAVTDADGIYRVDLEQGGVLVRLEVAPGPDTTRTTVRPERAVPPGDRTVVDVEVTHGVSLAGTVVDDEGRPVADAEVLAWTGARHTVRKERADTPDRTVRADAAGAFEVKAVGPRFVLAARAPGLVASDRLHGEIPVGKRAPGLVLHVSPERTLRVDVRGPDDMPLPEARVRVQPTADAAGEGLTELEGVFRTGPVEADASTGPDGRAEIPGLASVVYAVEVQHGEHAPWRGEHGPGDGELLVRLDPGAILTGTVLDAAGAPIPGAVVQLSSGDPDLMDRNAQRVETRAEGLFEFTGLLPDDEALLSVHAPGHAVRVVQSIPVRAGLPRRVRVILGPEYALEGFVTDPAGAPVAGALVEIEGDRVIDFGGLTMSPTPTWERSWHGLDTARTRDDGRFRLGGLYDGVFRVRVTDPQDPQIVALLDAHSAGPELHVLLDPDAIAGVTLSGSVRDALTGRPVPEFQLTPMFPSGEGGLAGRSHAVREEQGRFRLGGLEPGPMQVDVYARGYAPWSRPLREYGTGLHMLDVALVPSRTVRLRFVDEERAPVAGASVRFATIDGAELQVASGPGGRTTSLATDANGEVIASELPADRIVVGLRRGFMDKGLVYTVDLRVPPPPVIELVVAAAQRVELLVLVVAGEDQAAVGGVEGVLSLQARLADGSLAPLDVPARVEVRDGAGTLVAEGSTLPGAAPAEGAAFAPESAAVRLSVPREALSVRVSAPGYVPVELSWESHRQLLVGDMIAVTLVRP